MTMKLTAENSARVRDISFVAICCVVSQHFCLLTGYGTSTHNLFSEAVWRAILDWPVSWFFLISGFFLVKQWDGGLLWWWQACAKRIQTLLLPYIVWCAIGTALMCCYGRNVSLATLGNDLGITSAFPVIAPLWYVRNLLVLCLFSPVIVPLCKWLSGQRWGMVTMMGVMFSFMLLPLPAKRLWVMPILYFALGIVIAFGGRFPAVDRRIVLGGLCGVLLMIICNSVFFRMELPALRFIFNFFAIGSVWLFYDVLFLKRHICSQLSKSSFFVYCAHGIIMLPIYNSPSLIQCPYGHLVGVVLWVTISCGTVVFSIMCAHVLNACCPAVFKVLTGGRG